MSRYCLSVAWALLCYCVVDAQREIDFHKISVPLYDAHPIGDTITVKKRKLGYHPKADWPLHQRLNKNALPLHKDPVLQMKYTSVNYQKSLLKSVDGIPNSYVDPADPTLAVGPDHMVQMINASSGARFRIWDKNGNLLQSNTYLDGITGISGKGDPIAIYDHLADRWMLTEFARTGNRLVVAISVTNDPMGSYYVYSFTTPGFPDYPKYGLWPEAYVVTTNESSQKIYALDRQAMIQGLPNVQMQEFSLPDFPTIGFQAATPVSLDGTLAGSHNSGMVMRMADDAWSSSIAHDRLEIYELDIDWSDASQSSLIGPTHLNTSPFDTELCGYTGFSCIDQPNSDIDLDPLREVLMNRIAYRNFGSYEAIVCNHVVDVDNSDHAGIRWYELRNDGSGWEIFQEGTYAPDNDHRWMASIGFNKEGSIALAYNVSGANTYPSLRYTGRNVCDPLGLMTFAETTIVDGQSSNPSNRYGDYNTLVTDPKDGKFWFTGMYNDANDWNTKIVNFEIQNSCNQFNISSDELVKSDCAGERISFDFDINYIGGFSEDVNLSITDAHDDIILTLTATTITEPGSFVIHADLDSDLPFGSYTVEVLASSPSFNQTFFFYINSFELMSSRPSLLFPMDASTGVDDLPTLLWSEMSNAIEYQIQIAEDPLFMVMVDDQVVSGRFDYTLQNTLSTGTHYFWRVKGVNPCMSSQFSDVYLFTTNSCEADEAIDTPIAISSSGTPTISSILDISDYGTITDLNLVDLNVAHSWINDLTIKLKSPSGTEMIILENICNNENSIELSFDDAGTSHGDIPCPPDNRNTYHPQEDLSVFNGEEMHGEWQLIISDRSNFDGGTLHDWSLEICASSGNSCVLKGTQVFTICDDQGTSDPLDDRFSFEVIVDGWNLSNQVLLQTASESKTGPYQSSLMMDNNGDGYLITDGVESLTLTDAVDSFCQQVVAIEPPESCSNPLVCDQELLHLNTVCHHQNTLDASDDTFSIELTVTSNNKVGSPIMIQTDQESINTLYGSSIVLDNQGAGYMISEGLKTITITDLTDSSCQLSVDAFVPISCSSQVICDLEIIDLVKTCDDMDTEDPNDDTFEMEFSVLSVEKMGSLISIATNQESINDIVGNTIKLNNNGNGYLISDGLLQIQIVDQNDAACTLQTDLLPPSTCSEPLPPCDQTDLALMNDYIPSANFVNGVYRAELKIESQNLSVMSSGDVHFMAGQEVVLKAGFEVQSGAVFEAAIEACQN